MSIKDKEIKDINFVIAIDINKKGKIITWQALEEQDWIQPFYIEKEEVEEICFDILKNEKAYNKRIIVILQAESKDYGTYCEPDYETIFNIIDYYAIDYDIEKQYPPEERDKI